MKVSSVEEDELAIFLLPMPLSLPGGPERLECLLRFGRFPSRLKLSAASI